MKCESLYPRYVIDDRIKVTFGFAAMRDKKYKRLVLTDRDNTVVCHSNVFGFVRNGNMNSAPETDGIYTLPCLNLIQRYSPVRDI